MNVLLDTSIVLRAGGIAGPSSGIVPLVLARLVKEGGVPCVCAQVVTEMWAVLTRSAAANGAGLEPAQARAEVDRALAAFPLLPDPPALFTTWLQLCTAHEVRGRQVYDARLAAFMLAGGITRVVTLNPQDFARFSGVEVIVPK